MIECMGIRVLSLALASGLRGSDIYLHIVKKLEGKFSLNSAKVRALGWPLHGFFFSPNFLLFKAGLWSKSFTENILFFRAQISPVVRPQ